MRKQEKRIGGTGRNKEGRITIRWRGGGKRRIVGEQEEIRGIQEVKEIRRRKGKADVMRIEEEKTGREIERRRTKGVEVGNRIKEIKGEERKNIGDRMEIREVKVGEIIWEVEDKIGTSSGSKIIKVREKGGVSIIKLPSGEEKEVKGETKVTKGYGSNEEWKMYKYKKAGEKRELGKRGKVKGERMNAVDHPNGGRTRKGRISKTRWGKIAKK